ncbi:MAG TPA: TonB family protein [Candidatus Angelobacter sp.]|nr:TonB family protein [Candidatus Angelobacter sp.]
MATQASDTANNTAAKRTRGASPDELAVIAQRAQAFTNASGVAIALSEGNADEIVCRARSGASAPEVGAALRVEGTFTGLCIQSGKELRCDDCETDTRVDTAAIRALNIRSMVVTPIKEENRVIGVLAVFAPTAHAFTITHVAVLKTMADQISALLQRQRNTREEIPPVASAVSASPAAVAKPVLVPQPPATPPPVVIKPAAAAPARASVPAAKAEPVKAPLPVEVVPLAVPPRKEEKHVEAPARANFGTFDSVAGDEKKPGNNKMMLVGVVAVLLIAAAGTFALLKMRKGSAAASAQHAQEASSNQPSTPANSQPSTAANPVNTGAANANIPPAKAGEADKKPAGKTGEKNTNPEKTGAEKPSAAEKPVAVATLAGNGPSRIAQSSAQTPDVAPSFTVESGSAPNLSSLAHPVTAAPTAAIEQSQLEPLQLLRTVPPVYPPIAKARSITGAVEVEVKVDKNGKPSNPKFISGPPIFKDAAFEAVMKYQFKPAKLNGQPIEQLTRVKLVFR